MIPTDVANDDLIDYTRTLEFLAGHMMGLGCSVVLKPRHFEALKACLIEIETLGDGLNFQLEQCFVSRTGQHSVSWDNDGTRDQDAAVAEIMHRFADLIS